MLYIVKSYNITVNTLSMKLKSIDEQLTIPWDLLTEMDIMFM